jgi:hypothetical protein
VPPRVDARGRPERPRERGRTGPRCEWSPR